MGSGGGLVDGSGVGVGLADGSVVGVGAEVGGGVISPSSGFRDDPEPQETITIAAVNAKIEYINLKFLLCLGKRGMVASLLHYYLATINPVLPYLYAELIEPHVTVPYTGHYFVGNISKLASTIGWNREWD